MSYYRVYLLGKVRSYFYRDPTAHVAKFGLIKIARVNAKLSPLGLGHHKLEDSVLKKLSSFTNIR